MSRRWLLSLLCLSVLLVSLVQLTRARGEFRVNETSTRILIEKEPAEVLLSVDNSTGETFNARVQIELLDPRNRSSAKIDQVRAVGTGSRVLTLHLPLAFSHLTQTERRQLLWYRLHYRVSEEGSPANTIAEGIVSLSEITPNLFDIRVATSELAREGRRYRARVQATHPITYRPAADVRIDGEVTLEDGDKSVKLHASKTTDGKGYALLDFTLPPRFPQFPHHLEPAGGTLHVTGRKGAIVATAQGDVLVDQFARILVTSDKPLYQPGQVMHLRALVFTPSRRALANQNILIKISDPEETKVFRAIVKTSRFGVANTDWSIPENTRLGNYRIWVGIESDNESDEAVLDVRISRYDLPNFSVTVEPDRAYYLPGQNAEVKVRADYLFGQPVTRGHVRVVRESEREWNYREQKWDIEEGETFEGETDANGVFVAHINLAEDHEDLSDDEYDRFDDSTYAAYFTDPTTNRTEQRRFDLRVTKEAIHVYVIENYEWKQNSSLPLGFYVSTFYADGSPARCKVNIAVTDDSSDQTENARKKSLTTVRTNRYGLAKVSGVRLPREFEDESEVDLLVSAVDSKGLKGSETEDLSIESEETVHVETEKSLYRAGEAVTALVASTVPNQTLVVDLLRDGSVIRSERLKLRDGHGSVTFPYQPEFRDQLTVAAYVDFTESRSQFSTRTILYPRNPELIVNARTSQASYRPGEDAQVDVSVRSPEGRSAESALGVVVLDKAVEERFRTDQEFGQRIYTMNDLLAQFLGLNQQVADVTLRDLQRLDMSKVVSPEMDLVAEVMLTGSSSYFPSFHGGDQYEQDLTTIFRDSTKQQLRPAMEALANRYARTAEYPRDEPALRRLLSDAKIDPDTLRDPWGTPYRTEFFVDKQMDALAVVSNGADKWPGTHDDFDVERMNWPYFRPLGEGIDRAINGYHKRTGAYIRDSATLRNELSRDGFNLDQVRDRWGKPYCFDFEVDRANYVIKVRSAGPDGKFSPAAYYGGDDFIVWTSSIDYFEQQRTQIDAALNEKLNRTNRFPEAEPELRATLRDSRDSLETLRDPWNRPYYATFTSQTFYSDRVRLENRTNLGGSTTLRTEVTPVSKIVRFITLRSMGADGKEGTVDDFSVVTFTAVLAEQLRGNSEPQPPLARIVFTGSGGAIVGVVTDANGAIIAGVKVTALRLPERQSYEGKTDDNGRYELINLPPGIYEVRFDTPAFKTHVFSNVLVRVSNTTEVNASLQPGTITETVTVTAGAVQSLQTQSASVVRSMNVITKAGGSTQLSTPRLREYFPETLVWQPAIETDKEGRAQINFKLADNITTWKMVVIGSTEDGQIGTTEKVIKAFQPFFVEHDPPRVLTEGDEISLLVVVRNYLERAQKVDLEIKPEQWFALLGPARKQTSVAAGDAARETFELRVTASVKDAKQRITASGSEENDAIEKPVTVHPDGEELSITAGDVVGDRSVLELSLPENMIPNSGRAELKIYPNLMAHVIESVEAIMQRPYGCGEQTISSTYPSLLLMRHYKQSGEDSPLRLRAERYLNDGYSRLLNYRDESGGFTYWGHGEPDVALTAYALRFLTAASQVIAVDANVIEGAREWLIKKQRADGSWSSSYLNSTEDKRRNAVLTAYVTRVLAATETAKISDSSKRALDYLSKTSGEIDEPYLLASYALAAIDVRDRSRAKLVIDKLRTLAHAEGPTTHWSLETNTPFYGWGLAGRVETTALVVQALAKSCDSQTGNCEGDRELINRALLFLLKQKDRYGVWYSTQATINVLDGLLTLFSTNLVKSNESGATDILVNGRIVQTFQLPVAGGLNNPIMFDISQYLNAGKNIVEIKRAGGLPFASVQAVANFYVPWSDSKETNKGDLRLRVKFDKTESQINDEITCNVDAERVGFRGYGMMLAEIGLPPGADVDRSSLEKAMKSSDWSISQYDVLPDRVVVYLWPRAGGVKFNFKFRPRFGLNAKTASSVVYDYYNPESRAVVSPVAFRVK